MIFAQPSRSTGGAGARGILSGLMAGRQMKQQDQQMQAFKQQQDRADEKYQANEAFGFINNLENAQKNGGNMQQAISLANKGLGGLSNFADTNFSLQNINDFKNEDGSFTPEFINKYEADTGKKWQPDSASAGNYVDKNGSQVMMNSPLGSQVFDPDTFAAGSSNYKDYRDQKDMARNLQEAQISKLIGDKGEGPTYAEMKVMKDKGQLPDSMMPMFRQSQEKAKRAKGDARDTLATRPFEADIQAVKDGGTLGEGYNKALQLEQQAEGKYKNQVLDTGIDAYRDMMQVKADIGKLVESGVNTGIGKKYASEAAKYAKNYDDMSQDERQKQLNTVVMSSKISGMVSRYLKAMSGTAVTEDEFNRQLEALVGGDISKINAETVMAAMQATTDDVGKSIGSQVDSIEPMYPASKMWRQDRINKARNVKAADLPDAGEDKGGTQTVEEAGVSGIADQVKATGKYGANAVDALIAGLTSPDADDNPLTRWFKGLMGGKPISEKPVPKPGTTGSGTGPIDKVEPSTFKPMSKEESTELFGGGDANFRKYMQGMDREQATEFMNKYNSLFSDSQIAIFNQIAKDL